MIQKHFAVDMPFWRFSLNVLVVSCLGLVPLLLVYVLLTPGFGPMLIDNGMALGLFLRQVLTDGLVVVFVVNYLAFFFYGALVGSQGQEVASAVVLLADPPLRALIFIFLHGLIYFLSADWFGSFGGDHWLALRVVGPTLARSAFFENLEGVYLYATLGSALPIYAAAITRLRHRDRAGRAWMRTVDGVVPKRLAPVVLSLCLFAFCVLILTISASAIAHLQVR